MPETAPYDRRWQRGDAQYRGFSEGPGLDRAGMTTHGGITGSGQTRIGVGTEGGRTASRMSTNPRHSNVGRRCLDHQPHQLRLGWCRGRVGGGRGRQPKMMSRSVRERPACTQFGSCALTYYKTKQEKKTSCSIQSLRAFRRATSRRQHVRSSAPVMDSAGPSG